MDMDGYTQLLLPSSRHWLRSCRGFESPRTAGTLVSLSAMDEGAFFLFFLPFCSRSGGDMMSNFRPLLPSVVRGRRPSSVF